MYSLNPNKMLTEIITNCRAVLWVGVTTEDSFFKEDIMMFGKEKLILVNLFLISNDIYIFMK